MRVYISADIEGVAGVSHWSETHNKGYDYEQARRRMSAEVAAACRGALKSGASRIVVQDAHGNGRNLLHENLPEAVELLRGWSRDPRCMVQQLDSSFDALVLVGWHSSKAAAATPLAHSMNTQLRSIRINGEDASEFMLHSLLAAEISVPTVFLSGDTRMCELARAVLPALTTVESHAGDGDAVLARHPLTVQEEIEAGVAWALQTDLEACRRSVPKRLDVELEFDCHTRADTGQHYPGMERAGSHTLRFQPERVLDLMRALMFVAWS